jgi:hypothetical protein
VGVPGNGVDGSDGLDMRNCDNCDIEKAKPMSAYRAIVAESRAT